MRLFAIPNHTQNEDVRADREAGLQWAAARREPSDAPVPEMRPLVELSEAVRDANDTIDVFVLPEARDCFSNTHGRLMQAIAASRPLPGDLAPPEESRSGFRGLKAFQSLHFAVPALTISPEKWRVFGSPLLLHGSALTACILFGIVLGRHSAHQEAPFLPVTDIVADFDRRVDNAELELGEDTSDMATLAAGLSDKVGLKVKLPKAERVGAQLVGVRATEYDGVPTIEANFVKDGNKMVFFQAKAPQRSLRFVQEKRLGDKVFMIRDLGKYRVVAWRNDESVLAVVSPLNTDDSLMLASAMRDSAMSEEAA